MIRQTLSSPMFGNIFSKHWKPSAPQRLREKHPRFDSGGGTCREVRGDGYIELGGGLRGKLEFDLLDAKRVAD